MEISSIADPVSSGLTSAPANKEISSDFETFLKMLTVQLENQDPLNPVDSSDYAVQLATFSGVEQQVQTNDLLKQLSSQMGSGSIAQMASWVGMEARTTAAAFFNGDPMTVLPTATAGATSAEILVRDSSGIEVDRFAIGTANAPTQWSGITSNGLTLPSGPYQFETLSYADGALTDETAAEVYGRVVEVQTGTSGAMLVMQGGAKVDATTVTALREP